MLGPGAVIGTEMLAEGVVSNYTIKTASDSLLWILPRESYQQYLTVGVECGSERQLDPVQVESAKQYDQTMYHWVNQSQLPMKEMRSGLLSLIAEMFDGVVYDEDQVVWDPDKRGKLFRVLVSGKAVVGGEKRKTEVTDNAFDVDVLGGGESEA